MYEIWKNLATCNLTEGLTPEGWIIVDVRVNFKVWEWLNTQSGSIQMNVDILYEQIKRCH